LKHAIWRRKVTILFAVDVEIPRRYAAAEPRIPRTPKASQKESSALSDGIKGPTLLFSSTAEAVAGSTPSTINFWTGQAVPSCGRNRYSAAKII